MFRRELVDKVRRGEKTQTRRLPGKREWHVGEAAWVAIGRYCRREDSPSVILVVNVGSERLQRISAVDIEREGFESRKSFRKYWDSLYARRPDAQWDANPLVTVITFTVMYSLLHRMETAGRRTKPKRSASLAR